ncbi:uncharacterized protein [Euwallacea fornicatus]|uniref:uncharacterized protein n=1 Tax=Euwallacea fornicatus TaxID=995702 RepID=UPI00338F2DE7
MVGRVWAKSNDETIEYRSLTADRLQETILVLRNGFFPYENVCKAIGLANTPDAIKECDDMLIDTARHGVSLVAVDSQTGKIVGVALNKIQHKNVTSKEVLDEYCRKAKHDESKALYELMAQLEDNMDPFTPYNANCLLELVFMGVLPEYSKRGIGYQLATITVQLATLLFKGENVKTSLDENDLPLEPRPQVVTSLFTTFKTQNIGKKLNFEVQKLISYDELFYKNKSYRSILGNETEGITCECRRLR